MSAQRRMVPSETPRALAACEVDKPRGLFLIGSISAFQTALRGLPHDVQHLHNLRGQGGRQPATPARQLAAARM